MKLINKKGNTTTLRDVWSDDMEVRYGEVGTINDFLKSGALIQSDYDGDTWLLIPNLGIMQKPWFGKTREEALANIPK